MNKSVVFVLGVVTGAVAGGVGTYYALKSTVVNAAKEEIENYAAHAEKRIEAIRQSYLERLDLPQDEEDEETSESDEEEDSRINNNEGVKKYHHYDGKELPEYASKRVFTNREEKPVTTLEKEVKDVKGVEDDPFIEEIDESTYLENDEYEKETIDFVYPEENGYWGYETDNEMTVKQKYGKGMFELIGNASRWLMDYFDEENGIGEAYFRNKHLMTDFYVIIHNNEVES